jgi:hypothetical protein
VTFPAISLRCTVSGTLHHTSLYPNYADDQRIRLRVAPQERNALLQAAQKRKVCSDDLYRGFHFVFFTFGSVNGGISLKERQRIHPIIFTIQADSEGLLSSGKALTLRQVT